MGGKLSTSCTATGFCHLPVPERIGQLQQALYACPEDACFERAQIVTRSYQETEGQHPALRRAKALRAILAGIPIFIRPAELIVGQVSSRLGARSIYPEFRMWPATQETTPPEVWDYWHGRTLEDEVRANHPERLKLVQSEHAAGNPTGTDSSFGHTIVDYGRVLRRGFHGILSDAERLLAETPAGDREGQAFLQAVRIAGEAVIHWSNRYADLAASQAGQEADPVRAAELRRIADICRHVPARPAHTFHEALQSFWFTHLAMHIEVCGWSISAGRFDQYMWPFYSQDIASGCITRTEGWELLLNLWIKFLEIVNVRVKDTIYQNMTLGGRDLEGNDQSNELSKLCLDATVALRTNQPSLSVRWHPNIAPDFWDRVHWAIAQGVGMPAIYNDEVTIPKLVACGVEPVDAADYGIAGCAELCVSGKEMGVENGGRINLAKALELALNDGRSTVTGRQIGLPTGEPEAFEAFADLWQAYRAQVEYLCSMTMLADVIAGEVHKHRGHCPLMSCLLDGCLTRRRDLVHGGARYNYPGINVFGGANVCDGLLAVKRCVFEQQRVTMQELCQALRDNFVGYEHVRQLLAHSGPRFGNDVPEVDAFANEVNAIHATFCWPHVDSRNGQFLTGVWPVGGHVGMGHWTGATPDGRLKGTPLVDGVGACQGADRKGPTALLRSVARLHVAGRSSPSPFARGSTCNIKFSGRTISWTATSSPEGVASLRDLVTTFMALGGHQLQINVVDGATLRAAQAGPEAYADLLVRVGGFSAYFVQLGRDIQEEIISRTEHSL